MLSQSEEDEARIVLWARDFDSKGVGDPIMNYMWFDEQGKIRCVEKIEPDLPVCTDKNRDGICDRCGDANGNMICDEDESYYYECSKETVIPARSMPLGRHKIYYYVRDNEGNWYGGEDNYVEILVAEHVYHMFLPAASQE